MRKNADVVVIGGGTIGCAVAYNLAKKGFKNVVLLEKGYIASGSSGRCAAGFRQQWGTKINCLISRASAKIYKNLSEELDYEDIEYTENGYLLITYEKHQAQMLEKNLKLQNSLGIPSEKLTPMEAKEIVPYLNIDKMVAAFYCDEDGHVNPFKATFAYATAAKRLGVEVNTYTTVTGIETEGNKIKAVVTDKGTINTNLVVNAAGPYSKYIGQMLGLSHPIEPERHQILITEPMDRLFEPMVMSFHHNSYCQQVPHGGFIMGYGHPHEPKGLNYQHDWTFLEEMAQKITYQLPILKDVRVVRQWAGHYDISPDGQPVIGGIPEIEGYYLSHGCGKGFMLAPMIAQLTAELIAGEETTFPVDILNVERFKKGELINEPAVV